MLIMVKKFIFIISSGLMLTGCLAESMTLVQSGIGASQGRMVHSAISPVVSFGVKEATGKFPLEHVLEREKARVAKKIDNYEQKLLKGTKLGIEKTQKSMAPVKKSLNNQIDKFNDTIFKVKSFTTKNFKHKPRFSYKAK